MKTWQTIRRSALSLNPHKTCLSCARSSGGYEEASDLGRLRVKLLLPHLREMTYFLPWLALLEKVRVFDLMVERRTARIELLRKQESNPDFPDQITNASDGSSRRTAECPVTKDFTCRIFVRAILLLLPAVGS